MTLSIIRCHFCSKNREYQYLDVCCPETSSCASKPLLLRNNMVITQCMCQVSLGSKEVQRGENDFKYNKVPLFLLENHGITILQFYAPKLAFVQASRYYFDVALSYHNVCSKFIRIERGSDGGP